VGNGNRKLYRFQEAFCFIKYICDCGAEEVIWNSRDGAIAYDIECVECGDSMRKHSIEGRKKVVVPQAGDRVFIDMPKDVYDILCKRRAQEFVRRAKEARAIKGEPEFSETEEENLFWDNVVFRENLFEPEIPYLLKI
jgi:hypothetical protein